MKINSVAKGQQGRIGFLRKKNFMIMLILFACALGLLFLGLGIFETKGNVCTVLAALLVIPAARAMTGYILVFPFKDVSQDMTDLVDSAVKPGSIIYTDTIITSTERAMGLSFIVVTGSRVLAYTGREKEDVFSVQEYLGGMVRRKGYDYKVTVVGDRDKFISLLKLSDSVDAMNFESDEDRQYFEKERDELCTLLESVML